MNFKRFVILFVLVQQIVGRIKWINPLPRYNTYNNRVEEPYYCDSNNKDICPNNLPYTNRKVFWIQNGTYEVEFDFRMEQSIENYTAQIWVVKWIQNPQNMSQVLPPIVQGSPVKVMVSTPGVMDSNGVIPLNTNGRKIYNISLFPPMVCRPGIFACALVLAQNRTNSYPGGEWKSCAEVRIFSHSNDVFLKVTLKSTVGSEYKPATVYLQLQRAYSKRGFKYSNVKIHSPIPPNPFRVSSDGVYSITLAISDIIGFRSETIAADIIRTYKIRTDLEIIEVKSYTRDPDLSGAVKSYGIGIAVSIGFIIVNFMF